MRRVCLYQTDKTNGSSRVAAFTRKFDILDQYSLICSLHDVRAHIGISSWFFFLRYRVKSFDKNRTILFSILFFEFREKRNDLTFLVEMRWRLRCCCVCVCVCHTGNKRRICANSCRWVADALKILKFQPRRKQWNAATGCTRSCDLRTLMITVFKRFEI